MKSKIIISFLITLVLLILLGIFSLYKMMELSQLTQKMYDHPFTVSNATKSIQTNIISMHRYMKDVSTSKTHKELKSVIGEINKNEEMVYSDYKTVHKYYLGEHDDIQKSYKLFVEWKVIRDEVISLIGDKKYEQAQHITKNKGYKHTVLLNEQVEVLVEYANNKAKLFLLNSIDSKQEAIKVTLLLLAILITLVIVIVLILIKHINAIEKEREETLSLLYQAQSIAKIGTWKYDMNEDILEWSNVTYSIFGRDIEDVVKHGSDFFTLIHEDDLERVSEAYQKHLDEQKPYILTHKIVTPSGIKYIEQKCKTFFDVNGKPVVSHGIVQDVTDTMTEKIELNEKLVCDELTHTYNRFFFNKNIDVILKQLDPLKHLGVVMIDIDWFKKVNDTHGHDIGDSVLKELTDVVKASIRDKDYFIRWGGEEFILLIETQTIKTLVTVLSNIQKQIKDHDFTVLKSITCSFGAVLHKSDDSIENTIVRADKALYKAKDNGRDRIEVI